MVAPVGLLKALGGEAPLDGTRVYVQYVDPLEKKGATGSGYTGGWVEEWHPRLEAVDARDTYGQKHQVPVDIIRAVWHRPPHAKKNHKVWPEA